MAALFFLAFAFFAVGQAAVVRNTAQTAADSAALAAARADRDAVHDAFLAALTSGDFAGLGDLLRDLGTHDGEACAAAALYAGENDAGVDEGGCVPVSGPPGYTVSVTSLGTVGTSVVDGTETKRAHATATAVIEPRCTLSEDEGNAGDGGGAGGGANGGANGGDTGGANGGTGGGTGGADGGTNGGGDGGHGGGGTHDAGPITFACHDGDVTIDPTAADFVLDLSTFYTVHLSK
jgi:hypothetical protein